MKIEVKRESLIIVPECEQDCAYIEDSLGLLKNGYAILFRRSDDIQCGYAKPDQFVLRSEK